MSNDELRVIFREEIGGALVGFKEEVRGEMTAVLASFKGEMREEMAAVIQASEARMIQRIDQVQKNVLEVKGNVALLDQKLDKTANELGQRIKEVDQKVDQCSDVLNDVTIKIAEMQTSFYSLENKVDMFQSETRKAHQALSQQISETNRRLDEHIATPWNKTHPEPGSAA